MKTARVYIETSVISFVFADDSPELRRITIEFFRDFAHLYETYVSNVVLLEIDKTPDPDLRERLFSILDQYALETLPETRHDEVVRLASRYIARGAIPKSKLEDAQHAAYATIFQMDVLLSWNFRHLANVNREQKILAVNLEEGYRYPLRILSPLELMYE